MVRTKKTTARGIDFAMLPRAHFNTPEYRRLSHGAKALLIAFVLKFNGHNNGNIEFTEEQAKEWGIGSAKTFRRYRDELLRAGWIVMTRRGGLGKPTLYALTCRGIDAHPRIQYDHPFKYDPKPLHLWKDDSAQWREAPPERKATRRLHVIDRGKQRNDKPRIAEGRVSRRRGRRLSLLTR